MRLRSITLGSDGSVASQTSSVLGAVQVIHSLRSDDQSAEKLEISDNRIYLGILPVHVPGNIHDPNDFGGIGFEILAGRINNFNKISLIQKSVLPYYVTTDFVINNLILKKVPAKWEDELKIELENRKAKLSNVGLRIGHVYYMVRNEDVLTAYSYSYFPKKFLEFVACRGLPYFIEAVLAKTLLRKNIFFISTTEDPNESRIKQLSSVGLPISRKIDAELWLRSMGRGIGTKKNKDEDILP